MTRAEEGVGQVCVCESAGGVAGEMGWVTLRRVERLGVEEGRSEGDGRGVEVEGKVKGEGGCYTIKYGKTYKSATKSFMRAVLGGGASFPLPFLLVLC